LYSINALRLRRLPAVVRPFTHRSSIF
jgi:hypothetical protein